MAAASPPPPQDNYKNRLQEWTQRNNLKFPAYLTESKGEHHKPEFSSTVEVAGERFSSDRFHGRLKDAQRDAAKVAYEKLVIRDDRTDVLGLIDQEVVFCKQILSEFAVKTKVTQPTYSVDRPEGLGPLTLFVSSVLFDGNTYTGEAATNKKDAEQKAARAAVKSVLATNNICMKDIIRSKKHIINAITSSGSNKEKAVSQENCNAPTNAITTGGHIINAITSSGSNKEKAVSQENCNAPTNAITTGAPIKFVPAVGAVCPTADHGANIIPAADPYAQAISGSQKRKKLWTTGHNVPHPNMSHQILVSVPAVGAVWPAIIIPAADSYAQVISGSKKRKKHRTTGLAEEL